MLKSKNFYIIFFIFGLGYISALISEIPVRYPQTGPYSVCVRGQVEPDCERETGTKGIAYSGFPYYQQNRIFIQGQWKTYNKYDARIRVLNGFIFSAVYLALYVIIKKYAHSRD